MTLQRILEKLCGIHYEKDLEVQLEKVKCPKQDCWAYGRKPVCYMEWSNECSYREFHESRGIIEPVFDNSDDWRRNFVE